MIYLDEEKFGFSQQPRGVVAFERGHQHINLNYTVCSVDDAFITVTQNGTAKTVIVTVVHLGGWRRQEEADCQGKSHL